MGRADLLVASNRGPVSFTFDEAGNLHRASAAGGLAAALHPLLAETDATWVACAMSDADRAAAARGLMRSDGIELLTVEPDPDTYRMAYDVVSNSTLWFCHHHMFDLARRPRLDRNFEQAWEGYRELNRMFADVVCAAAADHAVVLVQDYHLCLLPALVARRRADLKLVHFTHTPFADPSTFRVLPDRAARELLTSMARATACGFHARRWERAFAGCCDSFGIAPPPTFVSPLTPDPAYLAQIASSDRCASARARLDALVGEKRVILSVDRVEPSKNLLRGLWAFNEMLLVHPELRGEVMMLSLAYLSRETLPEYLAYANEIEHTVQLVNQRWGSDEWTPVVHDVADDQERSVAALTRYDVLLVNPIRDGLNLVAKEGPILNANDGVLVLSREAGAFAELEGEALELNPFDVSATAETLAIALALPAKERRRRAQALSRSVTSRRPGEWLELQLAAART